MPAFSQLHLIKGIELALALLAPVFTVLLLNRRTLSAAARRARREARD